MGFEEGGLELVGGEPDDEREPEGSDDGGEMQSHGQAAFVGRRGGEGIEGLAGRGRGFGHCHC